MAHIHADSMLKYAADAAEHAEPWLLWECKDPTDSEYTSLSSNPQWIFYREYRRKSEAPKPTHMFAVSALAMIEAEGHEDASYLFREMLSSGLIKVTTISQSGQSINTDGVRPPKNGS